MKIRIKPAPLAALLVLIGLLDAVRGLAGPFAAALAFFPLFLSAASIIHVVLSYSHFGFHQDFSSDHPAKGEEITYMLHLHNHLPLPLSSLYCTFTFAGPGMKAVSGFNPYLGINAAAQKKEVLVCAYRGVYAVGADRFVFRDALGLFELELQVEAQIFHVYPELFRLGSSVESLASGGGEGRSVPGRSEVDPGVFHSLQPLSSGRGGRRIAWKRFAASGIPGIIEDGAVSSYGLRIILDLRPPAVYLDEDDRLAAEDLAVSTVFSLLDTLITLSIPVELVLGSDESIAPVNDRDDFDHAYALSTSILFTDTVLPSNLFRDGRAALIVSVRSISSTSAVSADSAYAAAGMAAPSADLYDVLESALLKGRILHLITVVPPSDAENESARVSAVRDRLQLQERSSLLLSALDSRSGAESLIQAFPI